MMPKRAPFPSEEAKLDTYFDVNVQYLNDNKVRLMVSDDDLTALGKEHDVWKEKYPQSQDTAVSTQTIVKDKNTSAKAMIVIMRRIYADIPRSKLLTVDYDTLEMKKRADKYSKTPKPKTTPIIIINSGAILRHAVSFMDSMADAKGGKPAGVKSCQLWKKIGEKPVDPSELTFVGNCSKWPFIVEFNGEDAGKTVYYWARWENTTGKLGNWGPETHATIGGM